MRVMLDVDNGCPEHPGVPEEADFQHWVEATLSTLDIQDTRPLSLGIRIVPEDESAQLNLHYRHKDKPTNVLSFRPELPSAVLDALEETPLGDLAICAAVVQREAREQDKPEQAHWAHMTVHGLLHLLGHDHEEPQEAEAMEALERRILATQNIADPYAGEQGQE
ncbi:MAG: rRNA maturation RNase YbeY [Pseudomonadales bacterium]|nr:rRNA maturation RNase YbeY [Pseudomonadales bacterium]MCP5330895.1 rRNA maturation RNase YbeY [Pseudomonadales bacterium]MCP5343275.1 rRNA maturation RNase YbeY [Pseudomonadales bacterium]